MTDVLTKAYDEHKAMIASLHAAQRAEEENPFEGALTVGDLIALLQKEDPSLPVCTEGCDCNGKAGSLTLVRPPGKAPHVLIERA